MKVVYAENTFTIVETKYIMQIKVELFHWNQINKKKNINRI